MLLEEVTIFNPCLIWAIMRLFHVGIESLFKSYFLTKCTCWCTFKVTNDSSFYTCAVALPFYVYNHSPNILPKTACNCSSVSWVPRFSGSISSIRMVYRGCHLAGGQGRFDSQYFPHSCAVQEAAVGCCYMLNLSTLKSVSKARKELFCLSLCLLQCCC